MRYLQLGEKHELPRIISIQNPYSLLNRSVEIGLSEISQVVNTSTGSNQLARAIRCSAVSTAIPGSKPS